MISTSTLSGEKNSTLSSMTLDDSHSTLIDPEPIVVGPLE